MTRGIAILPLVLTAAVHADEAFAQIEPAITGIEWNQTDTDWYGPGDGLNICACSALPASQR